MDITKGKWVKARWLKPKMDPPASLAGVGLKFEVTEQEVTGIVRHIRGDHPTAPTSIRVWVQPDAGGEEVIIDPNWIVEIRD